MPPTHRGGARKKCPASGIAWTSWNGKPGKTLAFFRRLENKSDEMAWLIAHTTDGYRIFDDSGLERGRYRSANELATHLAFALRQLDGLCHQIATDHFFAHLGVERNDA